MKKPLENLRFSFDFFLFFMEFQFSANVYVVHNTNELLAHENSTLSFDFCFALLSNFLLINGLKCKKD